MAGRRNSTPLFDLIGPQAEANEKPRYRSSAPPPAPDQGPDQLSGQSIEPTTEPIEDQAVDIALQERSTTAVAELISEPVEVPIAETFIEPVQKKPAEPVVVRLGRPDTTQFDAQVATPDPVAKTTTSTSVAQSTTHEPEPFDETTAPESNEQPYPSDSLTQLDPFGTKSTLADLKELILTGNNRLYLTSGLVIIGLVIVWFVLNAILAPNQNIDLDTSASLQTHGSNGIVDPLQDDPASATRTSNENQSNSADVPTIQMGASNTPPQPTLGSASPQALTADPRVPGQNYLRLATSLSKDEATRAAAFLTEQGCPAIAIGMDSGTLAGNNRERFLLVSLFDVPVGRYGAMLSDRTAHVQRVGELGAIWTKDHGGTVNFHDPFWKRYDP